MCGRFTLKTSTAELQDLFGAGLSFQIAPRYNIAPSQPVLAVLGGATRQFRELRWGLIPAFAKEPSGGHINARMESVADKPSFRDAIRKRRCLIVADGFYEWQKILGGKQPMLMELDEARPFAFAGIWEQWDKPGHPMVESCAILTTDANADLQAIHHRMPAVVMPHHYDFWLDPDIQNPAEVLAVLGPYPNGDFTARPVSTKVNSAASEGPECVAPPEPPKQSTLPGLG